MKMLSFLNGIYVVPQTSIVFPQAFVITNIVETVMNSGYGLTPTEIAAVVDGQLPLAQKLYQIEILQAAKLLADEKFYTPPGPVHPTGVIITFDLWADVLMEKLKPRIVPVAFCAEGKPADPVTRVCISEPITPPPPATCPPGFSLHVATGMCLEIKEPIICPTGFSLDPETGVCLEIKIEKIPWEMIGIGAVVLLLVLMKK